MNRILLALITAALVGFGFGVFVGPRVVSSSVPTISNEPASPMKTTSQNLDADLADYYRLKTLEEKYKKADEVLGKVILLFLQDLGLRVNPDLIAKAKRDLLAPGNAAPAPTESVREAPGKNIGTQPPPETPKSGSLVATNEKAAWKIAEKSIEEIQRDSDVADFLKRTRFDNPEEALKSFSSYSNHNDSLRLIAGRFTGQAHIQNKKGSPETWLVEVNLQPDTPGKVPPDGNESVIMSNNGKVFSRLTGSGSLKSLRDTNDSKAIVIRVGPGMFFQLYYWANRDQFIGNYYENNNELGSPTKFLGTVILNRDR